MAVVAEDFLYGGQGNSLLERQRCEGVPKHVRRDLLGDAGTLGDPRASVSLWRRFWAGSTNSHAVPLLISSARRKVQNASQSTLWVAMKVFVNPLRQT